MKRPKKTDPNPDSADRRGARETTRALVLHPAMRTRVRGDGARHVHPLSLAARQPFVRAPESRLEEAVSLALAIGLVVVHAEVVRLKTRRSATLFGAGIIERMASLIADNGVEVAVVDGTLSPVQQRNLERAWSCKVIDRTGLILEIFGERAHTREGTLQVELAALSYQKSRLVRSWTHLERQRGGFGFLGGPGERQIEADRRLIGERISRLKGELEDVRRTRELHRRARRRTPYPVVALVGYTNAGKSTLFNRLTQANVFADDRLFATLDTTMRRVGLASGREIILSDTVGFISDLPHDLIAAFRATLEEVLEADLIVHVRDIAHHDSDSQRADVVAVLHDLGLAEAMEARVIEALNKIDLLDGNAREELLNRSVRHPSQVPLSALTGEGCDALLDLFEIRLGERRQVVELSVELDDGAAIAWLYNHCQVLGRHDDEECAHMTVGLEPGDLDRFERVQAARLH